jgi:TatD DNase family protein
MEAGYFFSVPLSVIRSPQKQKMIGKLLLSSLLIETDSPVLGPSPGESNEPANAFISIRAIAELKGISREQVIEMTLQDTCRLYGDRIIS